MIGAGFILCGLCGVIESTLVRLRGVIVDAEVLKTYKTYINGSVIFKNEIGYHTREGKYVRTILQSESNKSLKVFSNVSVIYDKRDEYQAVRADDYKINSSLIAISIGLYILINAKL